jgi:hypothetical protein
LAFVWFWIFVAFFMGFWSGWLCGALLGRTPD